MDTLLEQATPRPWRADEQYDSIDYGYGIYGGGEPDSIDEGAVAWSTDLFGRDASKANAELIVRAVNAYEPLVKALRGLDLRCEFYVGRDHKPTFDACPANHRPRGGEYADERWCLPCEVRAALVTVESSPEREGGE